MAKDEVVVDTQNVSYFESGACASEIAAYHMEDYSIDWVLIGHSERRYQHNETIEVVAKQVKLARESNLGVVLSIGENMQQRQEKLIKGIDEN